MRPATVLITGQTGFLGTQLFRLFVQRGYDVVVPDKRYDLKNAGEVKSLFDEYYPEIVIHAAALCGGIKANRNRPAEFFYDNMMMGLNVLDRSYRSGVSKFVQIGSVCSYPLEGEMPFKEEDLWSGYPELTNAAYGVSKRALLTLCQSYRQQYDMNCIYLMPVNMYGPGDDFQTEDSHVIPALIRRITRACQNETDAISLWGTGKATREFLYVEDCAEAILQATQKYNKPEPINIATGEEISIADLANLISELIGFKGKILWDASMPDGQPRRLFDTSKAKQEFGFQAKTFLREGLKKTIMAYYEEAKCERSHSDI